MEDRRTARTNISITQENSEFINQYGGARSTGNGRYNISELCDDMITRLRIEHSPVEIAISFHKKKLELQAELAQIEVKAKTILGTTLDDFMIGVQESQKKRVEEKENQIRVKEERKQQFIESLRKMVRDEPHRNMRGLLTSPAWITDLKEHGISLQEALDSINMSDNR